MTESMLAFISSRCFVGKRLDAFESDIQLCRNVRDFASSVTEMCAMRMERLTVLSNSSGDLCERINENNLALKESSQPFPYIRVERLKVNGT
jgi:hypothetical protein